MLDVPRIVGLSILLAAVVLQAVSVEEIKQGRVSKARERQYLTHTIFPSSGEDERLVSGGAFQ